MTAEKEEPLSLGKPRKTMHLSSLSSVWCHHYIVTLWSYISVSHCVFPLDRSPINLKQCVRLICAYSVSGFFSVLLSIICTCIIFSWLRYWQSNLTPHRVHRHYCHKTPGCTIDDYGVFVNQDALLLLEPSSLLEDPAC